MRTLLVAAALVACLSAPAAGAQEEPFKLDPKKVDEAIEAAGKHLLGLGSGFGTFPYGKRHQPEALQGYAELILFTLLQSGQYKDGDAALGPLVRHCLEKETLSTYTASLGAMAFEQLNAGTYQRRLVQYAQYLCDQQAQNGQWDYGAPEGAGAEPAPEPPKGKPAPKPSLRPQVRKRKPGPSSGDHSNSQFAALGLRACLRAGIDVDPKVLQQARQAWLKTQNADGGWGYAEGGLTGGQENPTGPSNTSYGSMTAGGVSSLLIYDFHLSIAAKGDAALTRGLEWMAKNYDVIRNPKKRGYGSIYYLYALERVGSLLESDRIGNYEWYADGARHLMMSRKPGGTWHAGDVLPREAHVDTCFAILFLCRGTPPLKKPAPPATAPAGAEAKPIPKAGAGVVDIVAPGWRLMNVPRSPNQRLLGDARGRSNVLMTAPPNLSTHPTLRRELAVTAKTRLRVVVGHHETNKWTLLVKADEKEIHKAVVGAATSKDGWLEVDVDLSAHAGKAPLIELVAVPSGEGIDVPYWAEVAVVER